MQSLGQREVHGETMNDEPWTHRLEMFLEASQSPDWATWPSTARVRPPPPVTTVAMHMRWGFSLCVMTDTFVEHAPPQSRTKPVTRPRRRRGGEVVRQE
jgi:hypothetical protein